MSVGHFSYSLSFSKLSYYSWSVYFYYCHPLVFRAFFYLFFQFASYLLFFVFSGFFLSYLFAPIIYAEGFPPQTSFSSFTSANRDFDSHLDASFYYTFSGHHFLLPFSNSGILRDELPRQILDFGFEKVSVYRDPPGLVFLGLELNFSFARPAAIGIDFFDYILGRPRSTKAIFELLGFAFSAFCGGKALEAYYLQQHK